MKGRFCDRFDVSKVRYIDWHTPVRIGCPDHGFFERTPAKVLGSEHGCPACGRANRKHSPPGEGAPSTRLTYQRAHSELYREAVRRTRARAKAHDPERWAAQVARDRERQRAWGKTLKGRTKVQLDRQRRRSRIRDCSSVGLTAAQWEAVCNSQRDVAGEVRCLYCKQPCKPTIDHVVPIARGGRDEPSNIVAACLSCNSSKCDRLIIEWPRAAQLLTSDELRELAEHTEEHLRALRPD